MYWRNVWCAAGACISTGTEWPRVTLLPADNTSAPRSQAKEKRKERDAAVGASQMETALGAGASWGFGEVRCKQSSLER